MSVRKDERGAILVLGVFMALFATGCLAYVVGIGEAIWQRERMQDGADAAALSSAILHARGMNLIALINMTMAALLAVLVALRLVQFVLLGALLLAYGLSALSFGTGSAVIPPLTNAEIKTANAHRKLEKLIHPAIKALRVASRGVRIAIPWMAQARTIQIVMTHYKPPVHFGFVVPDRITLPTRDGTFEDLCDKSGEYVGDLVALPVAWVPGAEELVSEATSGLIDAGSGYFCGTEGAKPPQLKTEVRFELPVLPKRQACNAFRPVGEDYDEAEHKRLCDEATAESERSHAAVDEHTGDCVEDCDGIYEQRVVAAIAACAPRSNDDGALDQFDWQIYRFKRRYEMRDGSWGIRDEVIEGSETTQRQVTNARPCGSDDALVGPTWNTTRRRDGELVPVCESSDEPSDPGNEGDLIELEQIRVTHIFGCHETILQERVLNEGHGQLKPKGKSEQNAMAPQIMEDGVELGARDFQMRGAVIGAISGGGPEQALARFQHPERTANVPWRVARRLGHFGLAQAEYFFAVESKTQPSDTYLWAMRWQARLRRFRLPEAREQTQSDEDRSDAQTFGVGEVLGTLEKACQLAADLAGSDDEDADCDFLDLTVSNLVVH